MSGEQDISNLFQRVTALEQEDADSDQTVTRIVKLYASLGIRVKSIHIDLHQNRICGDEQPLYGAVTSADTFV